MHRLARRQHQIHAAQGREEVARESREVGRVLIRLREGGLEDGAGLGLHRPIVACSAKAQANLEVGRQASDGQSTGTDVAGGGHGFITLMLSMLHK